MIDARTELTKIIKKALVTSECGLVSFSIEHPAHPQFGDLSTNAAMVAAKNMSSNSRELATKIVQHILDQKSEMLEKVEVAGPGFINFTLSKKYQQAHCFLSIKKAKHGSSTENNRLLLLVPRPTLQNRLRSIYGQPS
jgi:arginyl-tRNA synthetase